MVIIVYTIEAYEAQNYPTVESRLIYTMYLSRGTHSCYIANRYGISQVVWRRFTCLQLYKPEMISTRFHLSKADFRV